MKIEILPPVDVSYLYKFLLNDNATPKILTAAKLAEIPSEHVRMFCHQMAIYGFPTLELVDFLRQFIGSRKAIEIGAGHGSLGRALGIPITDSWQQAREDVRALYIASGQPPITYLADVEQADALDAVAKHQPEVVIASWVTHLYHLAKHELGGNAWGVDEPAILRASSVRSYVHIGATSSHGPKLKILGLPDEEHKPDWLYGRGAPEDRRIWIWHAKNWCEACHAKHLSSVCPYRTENRT